MEAFLLGTDYKTLAIVDTFISFIWTDRYNKAGDFELYMPTSRENLDLYTPGRFLWDKGSEHMMIIESIKTTSDMESGNNMTVSGRSLESILDRRIIWDQTEVSGNLQNAIQTLLNNNIISPSINNRRISNFIFSASTNSSITGLEIDAAQYDGDNLYEVICKLCEDKKIGFKITFNSSNKFVFELYSGTNRSYSQTEPASNPFVVFSPHFENIINSEYTEDISGFKNVILVAGEGEGSDRIKTTSVVTAAESGYAVTGINRRETFLSSDLSRNNGEEEPIELPIYTNQLKEQGKEELKNYKVEKKFEGEVETSKMFIYKTDYFIGDIVELEDEYGRQQSTRVVEFIRSQDEDGYKAYPSFEVVDS